MMTLHERHSDIATQFAQGGFVVCKTKRQFSAIATDRAHEQNNKVVKGDGGAVGLLQNPKALLRWMVEGPELARFTEEFDINCLDRSTVNTDIVSSTTSVPSLRKSRLLRKSRFNQI